MKTLKIGDVELDCPLILAPMAGVTDMPFRLLCREQGCGAAYTEMVSAKAILYKNRNTGPLMETGKEEGPVALQLFGADPDPLRYSGSGGERALCLDRHQYGLSGSQGSEQS